VGYIGRSMAIGQGKKLQKVFALFTGALGENVLEQAISKLPQDKRIDLLFSQSPRIEIAKLILSDNTEKYIKTEDETESIRIAVDSIVRFITELNVIVDPDYIDRLIEKAECKNNSYKNDKELFMHMNHEVLMLYRKLREGYKADRDLLSHKEAIASISSYLKENLERNL